MRSTCRLLYGGAPIIFLAALLCAVGPAMGAGKPLSAEEAAQAGPIEWTSEIDWVKWEDALEAAGKTGRRICVLVYADDDPRSRGLAEAFGEPEMVTLAKDLIMVHQFYTAPWLKEDYAETGDVTPRILFVEADGKLDTDLNSGSKRLPYYYAARGKKLKDNLRAAAR